MLSIFVSKKGVSPLIATILLIAFAVALGSVIMNWGLNLNLGKEDDACSRVEFKIRSVDTADVCYGGSGADGYVNFVIDNTGPVEIKGLSIWVIGEKGTRLFDLENLAVKEGFLYDKKDREISYDFNVYGKIKEVQFIPKAASSSGPELCIKNAVKASKIGICGK